MSQSIDDQLSDMFSLREKDTVPMGGGKDFPPLNDNIDQFIVEWDGADDAENPQNWPSLRKLYISILVCSGAFVACFNSAVFAAGVTGAIEALHISEEVGQLGTTLFVLGFAAGPPLWAPASELYGRRWPLFVGMLGTSIFSIACATAKDAQTLLICRFFAGVFGASPLCVVPGVLADVYSSTYRGMAISIYALTVFGGPLLAPIVGSFVAASYLGWRWTQYLPAILGFANAALMLLFLTETYAPLVLAEKASIIRRQTGNSFIHAPHEKREVDLKDMMNKYFARPLRMLVTEPTVLLVSLYMSFIYGIVYALLEAYPFVYSSVYGWQAGVAHLPFIGLLLGVCCALALILSQQKSYARKLEANGGIAVPEWRLYPAMLGAVVFPIGLFWFAWTAYNPHIHWMISVASGVPIGFGVLCIFLPHFNYLVDAYLPIAASTVAANVMLRSAIASGFPLFSKQMFANLGVQWAGTLLGCLAVLMIPIPVGFYLFGPKLRKKSRLLSSP